MLKRKVLKLLSLLMIISLIFPSVTVADAGVKEEHQPVTIVFSHDMHSHLEKFPKLKTVIDREKAENKAVFVFDAGDFSMGTPYQAIYKKEASELRTMGIAGYDVTTFGNHEFDQRSSGVSAMLNSAVDSGDPLPAMVNSNIDWEKTLADKNCRKDALRLKKALKRYGSKDYTVIEKAGVKIAVFGIFGKNSASYAPESGTYFQEPVDAAKRIVKKIKEKEKADMIVCISHSGTDPDPEKSEDEILAKEVDGIDFIVSGHTHTELKEPIIHNDTVIGSAGQYNTNLGTVKFEYKDGKYEMSDYKLVPLDKKIPDNSRIADVIKKFKEKTDEEYFSSYGLKWDQVLTNNDINFTGIDTFGTEQGEDTLGNLISDSLTYGVKKAEGKKYEPVAVSIAPGGCIRASFDKGPVTVEEAFNALALGTGADGIAGYPLVSVYITGKELKLGAEIDASVSDLMNPARLYFSGLDYTYNPHRMFLNRASDIHLRDEQGNPVKIEDDKLYRCVADLYSAQMLGTVEGLSHGLLAITPRDKDGNPIEDYEKHIVHNQKGDELKEWYALASYLKSFRGKQIPDKYAAPEGRKIYDDTKGPVAFFSHPNKFMKAVTGIVAGVIVIIVLIIVLIVKKVRNKKKRKNNIFYK